MRREAELYRRERNRGSRFSVTTECGEGGKVTTTLDWDAAALQTLNYWPGARQSEEELAEEQRYMLRQEMKNRRLFVSAADRPRHMAQPLRQTFSAASGYKLTSNNVNSFARPQVQQIES